MVRFAVPTRIVSAVVTLNDYKDPTIAAVHTGPRR